MTDKLTSVLETLDDAIRQAYRVALEEDAFGRGDEHERRRRALAQIDEAFTETSLTAASAEQLLLLEVLFFYWGELVGTHA